MVQQAKEKLRGLMRECSRARKDARDGEFVGASYRLGLARSHLIELGNYVEGLSSHTSEKREELRAYLLQANNTYDASDLYVSEKEKELAG